MIKCNKIEQSGLNIGTWNIQGLCSDKQALGIGEDSSNNNIDIIWGQEI